MGMITLLDVRNQLIAAFCSKPIFEQADMDTIQLPEGMRDKRTDIINTCLHQLQDTGLIRRVADAYWMLNHPVGASGQEVKLSLVTCNAIAETINTFLKAQDDSETPKADALNLNEGHIITLLQILDAILLDERRDNDEGDEDDDDSGDEEGSKT